MKRKTCSLNTCLLIFLYASLALADVKTNAISLLDKTEKEMISILGTPEKITEYDERTNIYYGYQSKGLSINHRHNGCRTVWVYSDIKGSSIDSQPFTGVLPDNLSVFLTYNEIIDKYGQPDKRSEDNNATISTLWISYKERRLGFKFVKRTGKIIVIRLRNRCDVYVYNLSTQEQARRGDFVAQYELGQNYYYGRSGVTKNYSEALRWYKKSAAQGYSKAQDSLGGMYQYGYGVQKSITQAMKWFKLAAAKGNDDAQVSLGEIYNKGKGGIKQDNVEALQWFEKAAKIGNRYAQRYAGMIYLSGNKVPRNPAKAIKWLEKSARQNDMKSQYKLGKMYLKGEWVKQNYVKAMQWFKMASANEKKLSGTYRSSPFKLWDYERVLSQVHIGNMYQKGYGVKRNHTEAIKWFKMAADKEFSYGQYKIGETYYYGLGVKKNTSEAIKWYRKAAENGHAEAQWVLAAMYDMGKDIQKDSSEALKWISKSAKAGYVKAQYALGVMHEKGTRVKQDSIEAVYWYKKSAKQGYPKAYTALGVMYIKGIGVQKDIVQGLNWFKTVADKGYAPAQYDLGVLYLTGQEGVKKNTRNAVKWINKAVDSGHIKARHTLSILYAKGHGVPQDYIKAYAHCAVAAKLDVPAAKKDLLSIQKKMTPEQVTEGKKQAETLLAKKKGLQ